MREILPGIHHWTAVHENIKIDVSSYYVEPAGALIDPMVPPDGLGFFESLDTKPQQILLTNRHHYRHCDRFREAFGCPVRCISAGLHEFTDEQQVEGFEFGDEVAPGVVAVEVGGICPDDTALHVQHGDGALAFADGVINYGGLGFVPDGYWDDPAREKQAVMDSCRDLLERDFDHLLFAHGEPLIGGGHAALKEFVNDPAAGPSAA